MELVSCLINLQGKKAVVQTDCGQKNCTVDSVLPTSDLPPENLLHRMREAVNRSQFTIRLEDGTVIEGVFGSKIHFPDLND